MAPPPSQTDPPKAQLPSIIPSGAKLEEEIEKYIDLPEYKTLAELTDPEKIQEYIKENTEKLLEFGKKIAGWWGTQPQEKNNIGDYAAIAKGIRGIFGLPYQFSEIVDPIIGEKSSTQIGMKYWEKILSLAPVLFLSPGRPVFMKGYSKKAKRFIANTFLNNSGGEDSKVGFDDGQYYSFEFDNTEYTQYVDTALRGLAMYMGIEDFEIPIPDDNGTETSMVRLGDIKISEFQKNKFTTLFGGSQPTIPFFLDSSDSISESFSNSTTESALAGMANGYSSEVNEINFLTGTDGSGMLAEIKAALESSTENVTKALSNVDKAIAGDSILGRLAESLLPIVTGGKLVFPSLWADSSYSKSYSINLKLRSPDPDPVSIFLNIYMPLILLISMAAPRQTGNSANSYKAPFLVRAVYRSVFNCNLGIISSISIDKGGDHKWNILGHPTSADVSIQIDDLYSTMFISKNVGIINNTVQLDYLANMAGLNMIEPDVTKQSSYVRKVIFKNPINLLGYTWYGGVENVSNKINNFIREWWKSSGKLNILG